MAKLAVIDLGTNTFHLLIAEVNQQSVKEIYRERIFVKLAEEGIHRIGDAAMGRAISAIAKFKTMLDQHHIDKVRAFGTAGLRNASNGPVFIQHIQSKYKLNIEVISGDEEARLIHKGVMAAVGNLPATSLIMDIGGGSVEYIICDNDKVYWAQSFKIGVAVLYNQFHQNDPITSTEIATIQNHLDNILQPLKEALLANPANILIGASGTFDVLENMLVQEKPHPHYANFSADKFLAIYNQLITSSLAERIENPQIPNDRAELITVAFVLLNYTIQLAKTNEVIVSSYAMKEGMLLNFEE